jgi:hypothetical protein
VLLRNHRDETDSRAATPCVSNYVVTEMTGGYVSSGVILEDPNAQLPTLANRAKVQVLAQK